MTVVLVHGNPETDALWDPLVEALGRDDVIRLSPPGFGAPVPHGWAGTYLDYRDWLVGELARIDGPIDLVGHDWGGNHVVNAMMLRPELVRSWATDIIGVFDPEYVWHEAAQIWQTPGAGEQFVDALIGGSVQDRAGRLTALGITDDVAARIAVGLGPEMGAAILGLYRSVLGDVLAEEGRRLGNAAVRPGLCLLATEDHYTGSEEIRRRAAERAGARTEVLEGLGHWWMVQDPVRGAAALTEFWDSLVTV